MNNHLLFDKLYNIDENNARPILGEVRSPVTVHGFKGSPPRGKTVNFYQFFFLDIVQNYCIIITVTI